MATVELSERAGSQSPGQASRLLWFAPEFDTLKNKKRLRGTAMERREFIALAGMAAVALPTRAQAEPASASDTFAGRLVGTWEFSHSVNTRRDGSVFDRWGPNPKGILMFDRNGHYSQIIIGAESRLFGAKTYCAFGTYSVQEPKKILTTRIDACSVAKFSGTVQNRDIISLTTEELKYWNPITASGNTAEVLWKRIA
jgi:hypothetical protein